MKTILTALFLLVGVCSLQLSAQTANEGARTFAKKSTANGISIVVMGQPKNVETVLDEKLQKVTGTKSKSYKSLRVFEGARAQNISASTLDIYYEVEKAAKDDDTHSRVTIFLSSGNENFLDSRDYPDEVNATAEMLEGLEHEVNIYEMKLAIDEQQKVIEKANKDHEKMVKDSVSLEVKLAETLQAIEENKVNRANQLLKIAEEGVRLEEFRRELARLEEQE
jgi:hypothetical protein